MSKRHHKIDLTAERADWEKFAEEILDIAKKEGATSAEVALSTDFGFSTRVRLGEVETLEHHQDKGFGVTVYFGQQRGTATASDMRRESLEATVKAACHIARLTQADEYSGLADPKFLAKNCPDLDLYHPWSIQPNEGIAIATECETLARGLDKRIVNSEGVDLSTFQGLTVYANSNGFLGDYLHSRHSISAALVAQDANGMQRDGDYSVARDAHDLETIQTIAKRAADRTVKRLGARKIKTCQVPVIFHSDISHGIIGYFLSAIAGSNIYRKSSFLLDKIGKSVFSSHMNIVEKPHLLKGLGSSPFDAEGVAHQDRSWIENGVLQGYMLGSYSARRLGMQTTGNAGGSTNILVETSQDDLETLLKKMDKGLLITELMGQGVNVVTGDYSRGAVGYWVENGVIQYPVEEITVAGNLAEMFHQIVAVGNDINKNSSILTGSILLEKMTIGGES